MQEKKVNNSFVETIKDKLSMLFLHCVFSNPEFIKGEISKHLELPKNKIGLNLEKTTTDENNEEVYRVYRLNVYDEEFLLRYDRKVEKPREIKVPKVVTLPKKWYQSEPSTRIVVEPKQTKQSVHWVLNMIDI